MGKKSIWARHIIFFGVICLAIALFDLFGIGCPIKYYLCLPCPTCGVSRAVVALLKFDFKAYVEYNVMAVPLTGAVWAAVHLKILPHKRISQLVIFAVLLLNTVYYIARLFNGGLDFL